MWIMTDEENSTFVYELNEAGVNRWSFGVQAGFDNDGKRTTEEELHKVAKKAAAGEELMDVLKQAKLGLEAMVEEERCGDTFMAVVFTLDRINNVLSKVGE